MISRFIFLTFLSLLFNCKSVEKLDIDKKFSSDQIAITLKTNGYYYSEVKTPREDFFRQDLIEDIIDPYIIGVSPLTIDKEGNSTISDEFYNLYNKLNHSNNLEGTLQYLESRLGKNKELPTSGKVTVKNDSIFFLFNSKKNRFRFEMRGIVLNDSTIKIFERINHRAKNKKILIDKIYKFKEFDY